VKKIAKTFWTNFFLSTNGSVVLFCSIKTFQANDLDENEAVQFFISSKFEVSPDSQGIADIDKPFEFESTAGYVAP
jgi:hypothetical protein